MSLGPCPPACRLRAGAGPRRRAGRTGERENGQKGRQPETIRQRIDTEQPPAPPANRRQPDNGRKAAARRVEMGTDSADYTITRLQGCNARNRVIGGGSSGDRCRRGPAAVCPPGPCGPHPSVLTARNHPAVPDKNAIRNHPPSPSPATPDKPAVSAKRAFAVRTKHPPSPSPPLRTNQLPRTNPPSQQKGPLPSGQTRRPDKNAPGKTPVVTLPCRCDL